MKTIEYSSEFVKLRNGQIRGCQTVWSDTLVGIVNACSKMKQLGWLNVPKVVNHLGRRIG